MSNLIIQWPVMAAMRLGVETPHGVALVFSLVTNLLPGLIILLCLPALPAGERHFFIFPCFVYFAGILSAQFASVAEGSIATSYFWLLLCLIAFGHLTILRLALIAVLAVGSLRLHEQMSFLGPILVVSCAMRWRHERRLLPRIVLSVAALCALASTVIAAHYVLHPFTSMTGMALSPTSWLSSGYIGRESDTIFPASWESWPLPCIVLTMVRPAWELATTWIFAALSIPLAFAAFWLDWLIAPYTQFAARNNGALMSLPLAALLLFARVHAPLATAVTRRPARAIVVILGLTVSLWHVGATEAVVRLPHAFLERLAVSGWHYCLGYCCRAAGIPPSRSSQRRWYGPGPILISAWWRCRDPVSIRSSLIRRGTWAGSLIPSRTSRPCRRSRASLIPISCRQISSARRAPPHEPSRCPLNAAAGAASGREQQQPIRCVMGPGISTLGARSQ